GRVGDLRNDGCRKCKGPSVGVGGGGLRGSSRRGGAPGYRQRIRGLGAEDQRQLRAVGGQVVGLRGQFHRQWIRRGPHLAFPLQGTAQIQISPEAAGDLVVAAG